MNPRRRAFKTLLLCVAIVGSFVAVSARAQTQDPAELPAPMSVTTTAESPPAPAPAMVDGDAVVPPAPAAATSSTAAVTALPRLRDDEAAEAAYRRCKELLARPDTEAMTIEAGVAARACYADVVAAHADTVAALKASAGLMVFDALLQRPVQDGPEIPAGRLGVSATLGLFGVWNAVAGGILVGINTPNVDGPLLVAGSGAAAVGLGIAAGVGGYYLAEALKLDEGSARLVASGVVWGTVLGTAIAPSIARLEGPAGFNLALGGVVGAGYVGGGAALLLSSLVPFDEAQVSMINSGGLMGSTVGLLLLPNLAAAGVQDVSMYSMTYIGSTMLGLTAGGVVGRHANYTWGETLLCDLGAVLGVVAGGTASVVLGLSGSNNTLLQTATPAVGLVGGYVVTALMVREWRADRGAPIWRDAPSVRPVAMAIPVGRSVVPSLGVMGSF